MKVDERRVAFHEAGHAVAEVLLLNSPHMVTIEPGPGRLGSAGLSVWSDIALDGRRLGREELRCHIVVYLAGPWAAAYHESKCCLKERARHVRRDDGNGSDYFDARCLLRRYFPRLRIETVEAEARAHIRTHWCKIEAVAHALVERKTLTAEHLVSIVTEPSSVEASRQIEKLLHDEPFTLSPGGREHGDDTCAE